VGTEKRERQKANRALKQQQEHKQQRSRAAKQRGLRIGVIALLALAGVVFIAWIGGAFEGDDAVTTVTTVPVATDPDDPAVTTEPGTTEPGITDPVTTEPGGGVVTLPTDDTVDPPPVEPTECPPDEGADEQRREFDAPPPMCIDPEAQYEAVITTSEGELTVLLDAERAPMTVNNFVVLARYRFFDDTVCHRIIPDFVAQCGDPTATGTGGPGYRFPDELPEAGEYQIGSLAMANSGPDTNGSQFFIITGERGAALPPQYSLFGQVTEGLDDTLPAIDALGNPDPASNGVPPLEELRIESVVINQL
jgi:cyclophilin family peptidyl-prolyl cis-trans isomerase